MRPSFRVIDTGVRDARMNIAFDQALIDARKQDFIPDTIRFLKFPPCALVGVHQILNHEVRLQYCRDRNIQIGRRITGGGGLYLDEGQIGWELVFDRATLGISDLTELTRRICEAAALGLRNLGVDAQYRPRNDIEVDGRKISGTGGFFDGSTLFYQGTLLIDFDPADMIAALKVPVEKLAKRDLDSARQRVVTLRELLGDDLPDVPAIKQALLDGFADALEITPVPGEITDTEETLAREIYDEEIGTDDYVAMIDAREADDTLVTASLTKRGGTLRADIRLEGHDRNRIREVLITGDFFVTPPRVVFDLEARLRGVETAQAPETVIAFFEETTADFVNLEPEDFRDVIAAAVRQLIIPVEGGKTLRGHMIGTQSKNAPTLVFLHEALGCARMWRDIPHRLAKATGLPALVYDRLGAGDSDPLEPPFHRGYILEEALEVLPSVLDAARIDQAILVGHSDGAAMALTFAGAHPDRVRGIVAEAPHIYREDKTLAEINRQIHDFRNGDLKARLERFHGSKTERLFQRLVEAWTVDGAGSWGIESYVAKVKCPVLLLQGKDDEFFSEDQLDGIEELLSDPCQRVVVPHCGHAPHHQNRRAVLDSASQFIRNIMSSDTASDTSVALHRDQHPMRPHT